jgi:hypothetical protein
MTRLKTERSRAFGDQRVDDPRRVRPLVISDDTLAFRRLIERFGSASQKRGHLHHAGMTRSSSGDDRVRTFELACECGATFGPWRDI